MRGPGREGSRAGGQMSHASASSPTRTAQSFRPSRTSRAGSRPEADDLSPVCPPLTVHAIKVDGGPRWCAKPTPGGGLTATQGSFHVPTPQRPPAMSDQWTQPQPANLLPNVTPYMPPNMPPNMVYEPTWAEILAQPTPVAQMPQRQGIPQQHMPLQQCYQKQMLARLVEQALRVMTSKTQARGADEES